LAVIGPRLFTPSHSCGRQALGVPGPGPEVPVHSARGRVADRDDRGRAVLAPGGNLPLPQIQVTTVGVVRVVTDCGEFGQPDTGRPEHRDDRGVAALSKAAARTGLPEFR